MNMIELIVKSQYIFELLEVSFLFFLSSLRCEMKVRAYFKKGSNK